MRFVLQGAWTSIVDGKPREVEALTDWLQRLECAAGVRLLHGGRFPAGYLGRLQTPVPTAILEDTRVAVYAALDLRDYQIEAVEGFFGAGGRGILELPPGAGKTRCAAAAVHCVPGPWLYLASRDALVEQSAEAFRAANLSAARPDEAWADARVVCSTWQGFDPERTRAPWAGLIVDECHDAGAPEMFARVMAVPASVRMGLSATPFLRQDAGAILTQAALGPVVARVDTQRLVEQGFLSPGVARFVPFQQVRAHAPGEDYERFYQAAIVGNDARNRLIAREADGALAPRLVLAREVAHAERLAEILSCPFLSGEDPPVAREAVLRHVRSGALRTLVATGIADQGLDLPGLETVIVAGAGKAPIAAIQRLGRGTRRAPGKFSFELIDVQDRGDPWLSRHAEDRAAAYAAAGYLVRDAAVRAIELPEAARNALRLLAEGPQLRPEERNFILALQAQRPWYMHLFWFSFFLVALEELLARMGCSRR